MKLKLQDGSELELVYSFRVPMYFEQMTQRSLDYNNFSPEDLLYLFYAIVYASLQKQRKDPIALLDLMDIIDDNGGEKCMIEFANFYIDRIKKEYSALEEFLSESENEDTDTTDDTKKKKD